MKSLLKDYIKFLLEDLYRGHETVDVPDFHKSLVWADYWNDARGIGMSPTQAREYANKETTKDHKEYLRKKRLYTPRNKWK